MNDQFSLYIGFAMVALVFSIWLACLDGIIYGKWSERGLIGKIFFIPCIPGRYFINKACEEGDRMAREWLTEGESNEE